jgi:hypothetical protein
LPSQVGISGSVPIGTGFDSETEEYINRVETLWKPFLPQFKDIRMSGEQWEFFRMRPENFPTKRIAGMSYILSDCKSPSLLAMFLPAFDEVSEASRRLRDMIMHRAAGYWTRHYTFGGRQHKEKPFLIGQNRAADIVINIVLPVALVYARQSRDEELQQNVMEVYAGHQRLQDNKITRYVTYYLFRSKKERGSVINSAMRQQGLIYLYKSFCVTGNCQNCPLM